MIRLTLFFLSLKFIVRDFVVLIEYELVRINSSSILITILLDWISLLFISFVLFISSIVIFYRQEYILGDLNLDRFILLVIMFVFSMILLIISPNLIRILLGWDGLGLVSYCLVIYYQNEKSYAAGILTALRNRIGDVALLIRIAWMLNYGRWNYVFYIEIFKNRICIEIITWIVILAAITKRAQIPFSSWLPAAIAAPTPVSSLVHSSTLVTAGVYLLIRFRRGLSNRITIFLLFISRLTILIAGLGANFEYDLKKIIALSTLRQLGLIMRILFLGDFKLVIFHLLTHALFKALLFICAGAIIHNLGNCQDIRFIGNLGLIIPLTVRLFLIRNLALCGLPFLSGFYSKDLILELLSISYLNIYVYLVFYVSTGLTMCYRIRLVYYTLIGDFNHFSLHRINDQGIKMIYGIIGLIFLVIFMGRSLRWLIFASPSLICLPFSIKLITLFVIVIGAWIGYECSLLKLNYRVKSIETFGLTYFLGRIWFIPFIRTYGVNFYMTFLGSKIYTIIDQGWSEIRGSQNIFYRIKSSSIYTQFLHGNNIKIFLLIISIFISMIIVFIYLNSLRRAWYWRYQGNTIIFKYLKGLHLFLYWKYNVFLKLFK